MRTILVQPPRCVRWTTRCRGPHVDCRIRHPRPGSANVPAVCNIGDMATISDLRVEPMNEMTGRWIAAFGNHATVASGAAVWPLLAIIAGAAEGEARAELAAATGIDPEVGTRAGR